MNTLSQHITTLVENRKIDAEKDLANAVQTFAAENQLSYLLELKSNEKEIPLSELDKQLNDSLTVKISSNNKTYQWKPLDNKNIFILT